MGAVSFPTLKSPCVADQLLFTCTRQQFLPAHRDRLAQLTHGQTLHWDGVYGTAVEHGVAPLVYTNLRQCPEVLAQIHAEVRDKFDQCTRSNVLVKSLQTERIRGVLEFFAERGVPVLLIKGASLDRTVYRQPWYTLSADIDLMIQCRQQDFPAADLPNVHALVHGRNPFERRTTVEFEWFCHHDISMNNLLPVDYEAIWDRARTIDVMGRPALVMRAEEMLLAACTNSCRKRFFRLKALCDITEIIQSQAIDWDEFIEIARRWHCEAIAYTALLVAAMTLECPVPSRVLGELGVPSLRRHLIQFLSRRQSFASLASLSGRSKLLNRQVGTSLLLPLAVYRFPQTLRNFGNVWRDRNFARDRRLAAVK